MGDKIALVEKIVAVLPKMKCPHLIQPHEIQGFNYIAIFPVVQWLVKQVIINDNKLIFESYLTNKLYKRLKLKKSQQK